MMAVRFVRDPDAYLARSAGHSPSRSTNVPLLLGSRLHVDLATESGGWIAARTMPDRNGAQRHGFVRTAHIDPRQQLKVFYLDVGQGDATLIEAEGRVVIIDGGPNRGFYDVLKARLADARRAAADIGHTEPPHMHIDAIIITHFDKDHYYGLRRLFEDAEFRVGTLYHNGLPRYGSPAGKDLDIGDVVHHRNGTRSISTDLNDSGSAQDMIDAGELQTPSGGDSLFSRFMQAVRSAEQAGRVGRVKKLYRRVTGGTAPVLRDLGPDLVFEVIAPLTTRPSGAVHLPVFPDPHDLTAANPNPGASESHTVNGNSVVLRLVYGHYRFLFGGDLNQPAQAYLRARYGDLNPLSADVNKACHHGSSDFDLQFLKDVAPSATVFSSGDNGSYDHPLPDAMGAAARHSTGEFPLVFSTELARDNKTSGEIMLGHINARCNGTDLVMAQKKEKAGTRNPWHTFRTPYDGPFGH